MAKVFVVQETMRHNVLPAQQYGELHFLLPPQVQIGFSPGPMISKMRRLLTQFTDEDYLLLIGDPAAMSIAAALASEYNGGKFRFLKWDKREMKYFPIAVNLNQKGESYEY
jgi:hypothetical protein